MTDTEKMVDDLIDVDNYFWGKYGYTSRPSGYEFVELVLNIADYIAYQFDAKDITKEVQEILTNENYHTLNKAIDIVKQLQAIA